MRCVEVRFSSTKARSIAMLSSVCQSSNGNDAKVYTGRVKG
jgi:hypothetical protein